MNYYPHHIGDFDKATRVSKLPMVYVITTPDFRFIKVGKTSNFRNRLRNIRSGCPLDLNLWTSIRTPKPDEVEAAVHKRLVHCRERGEWFKPGAADLDDLLDFCELTNKNIKEVRGALLQA